ncbi:CAMK family protein kinase [Histomonas meleagridis]|uniref:CAMK family protein kinase n=1 Tax=Histomonas meleagridis TaxID=135588 RepID=UPI003559EFBB|nr:CAMK family protein kinase [Histomonas meleagridis]KAH0798051.1 CAMK family protein kinase [Histomonas meleagridis]
MLTVDPTKRITISEIKQHPVFRLGLDDNYILPTPNSVNIDHPIDRLNIDPEIINVLLCIGYESKEQIIEELTSPKHSMAKVFFAMLNKSISLDDLPWNNNNGTPPVLSNDDFELIPMDNLSLFSNGSVELWSSTMSFGLASWDPLGRSNESSRSESTILETCFETVESLFTVIQQFLTKKSYEMLYPNQIVLIARKQTQQFELYVKFAAVFERKNIEESKILISITKLAGLNDKEELKSLIEDFTKCITQYNDNYMSNNYMFCRRFS